MHIFSIMGLNVQNKLKSVWIQNFLLIMRIAQQVLTYPKEILIEDRILKQFIIEDIIEDIFEEYPER